MSNNADRSSIGSDSDEEISEKEDVWKVVSALLRSRGFIQNQLDSFNKFFNQTLPEMVTDSVISFRHRNNKDNNYCSGLDYLRTTQNRFSHSQSTRYVENIHSDDRDHFGNKRLDLAGPLLGSLFGMLYLCSSCILESVDKEKDFKLDAIIAEKAKIITSGLKYSLATGNWGKANAGDTRTGVLNRITYASTLSHLRRISSPIGREVKLAKPMQLHNSQWGMMCPAETPVGQACGLVKNLALMVHITVGSATDLILECLKNLELKKIEDISPGNMAQGTKFFVNGCWVSIHRDPDKMVKTLKSLRRRHAPSDAEVGLFRDFGLNELHICTDYGCCCRPLFVVEKQRLLIKKRDITAPENTESNWTDLLEKGFLEYIDAKEEENTLIAMTINDLHSKEETAMIAMTENDPEPFPYTHCEIHPSLILGVCASIIPFPNRNQSIRNTYQSVVTYLFLPVIIVFYDLSVSVIPLQNAIVANASYSGYNQGDSIIMNQSSIDRGLFRSLYFHTYTDKEKRMGTLVKESFGRPDRSNTMASTELGVSCEDVIIGKTTPIAQDEAQGEASRYTRRDHSISLRHSETGTVDQVILTTSADGLSLVKVKVRSVRIPQIGDKFSSMHGQKGTVGMTYGQEDMPWTVEGITPDIILNPYSFPARMTVGQLMECIMGKEKAFAQDEEYGDATPFTDLNVDNIFKALHDRGYQKHGFETMYNGHTGRRLPAMIFIGPTYYQKLKHMVEDKIQSRARGPVQILTRQPVEGRACGGGMRLGEMERDCLISHGSALTLKERLFDQSDVYRVHVCDHCGLMVSTDLKKNSFFCKGCNNRINMVQVHVPYAWKQLLQELMAMAIAPRMFTKEDAVKPS
ncbi:hypothetical protein EZV62_026681 [Acer yangbiense]|uniref:DNA-directed RNA polymerase subunit beta n=1 Tax=Acer yangbiense TaxID=1000413 RepID=A0A5C7GSE8_9ROSI|nr:hypothetical protein EZV62_026681 [Acer yangbiense]